MRLSNQRFRVPVIPGADWLRAIGDLLARELGPGQHPLRFYLARVENGQAELEATVVETERGDPESARLEAIELFQPRRRSGPGRRFAVAQIVPTGIRCEIGGFAGDAAPATNLLASVADLVVTHPNAVNASDLNEMATNVLYTEGRSLDDFMLGHLGLGPVRTNVIGTFVDPTGRDYYDSVRHVLGAALAAAGIDCRRAVELREPPGVEISWTASGCASGLIANPRPLLDAVQALLDSGATAIGGLSVIHGVNEALFDSHLSGKIPNPSGSVEAIITHLISKLFRVPAAHAPLPYYAALKKPSTTNPRASAEFISTPHYFSVLKGLHRAPRLVSLDRLPSPDPDLVTLDDVAAVVAPATALGGLPVLAAVSNGIPVIAVRENRTILQVTAEALGLAGVIEVGNYLEAAGVVASLRAGIALQSLRRPLEPIRISPVNRDADPIPPPTADDPS